MKKKFLAVLLAACLLLSILPVSVAMAADEPVAEETLVEAEAVPNEVVEDVTEAPAVEAEIVTDENPEAAAELAATDLKYFAGEVIVVFESGADVQAIVQENAGELKNVDKINGVGDAALVGIPTNQTVAQAVASYTGKPGVKYAQPNGKFEMLASEQSQTEQVASAQAKTNDPLASEQWYLDKIKVPAATDLIDALPNREKVRVAVIDCGLDFTHEDLKNVVNKELSRDFTSGSMEPYPETLDPGELHATHVSGIIAAEANNGKGIAGVASGSRNQAVEIMSCRIMSGVSVSSTYGIALAISWAVECGAKVLNMSIGGQSEYPIGSEERLLRDAIDAAVAAGSTVVAAAGNENSDGPTMPADYESAINVIATTNFSKPTNMCRASFSNYGILKDISAPGEDILSSVPGNKYEEQSGTSMATPVVSGVAALMYYAKPDITPFQVRQGLTTTATDLFVKGFDFFTAWGNVDTEAAVKYALNIKPTPPEPDINWPVPPTDVNAANVGKNDVTLKWTKSVDPKVDGYIVMRSEAKYKSIYQGYNTVSEKIGSDVTQYVDKNLEPGKKYHYAVVSYYDTEDGDYDTGVFSNRISVTTKSK